MLNMLKYARFRTKSRKMVRVGSIWLGLGRFFIASDLIIEVKLSEIAIGIGPFVIAPLLLRKIGTAAMSELSLATHAWKSADWAHAKGLLSELHSDFDSLEEAVKQNAERISAYIPKAVAELKKALWKGTEDWDNLLEHNAAVSGSLVLSDRTQQTLKQLKSE